MKPWPSELPPLPAATPLDNPVALLLRHAERPPLAPGEHGTDLALTARGLRCAELLGTTLGPRILSISTSPVRRCRDTAEALRRGANIEVDIVDDHLLGDPGVFVLDPELAWTHWQTIGHEAVRRCSGRGDRPKDKDRLYASKLDGQIHTSADGGKTWQLLANLNEPEVVLDNMFGDSRESQKIYASGHRHKSPGGFFRSTDGGVTWKESKELHKESIHALTQSTVDPNILLAGTINGVWRSKNSGGDWEKISSATMPVNIDSLAVDPRSADTMYAGTWWRAYKTTDSGKNWRLGKIYAIIVPAGFAIIPLIMFFSK